MSCSPGCCFYLRVPSQMLFVDARGLVQPLDVALIEDSGKRCLAIRRNRRPTRVDAGASVAGHASTEHSTIVREVYSGDPASRLFVVHSDEWLAHDRELRERSMAACAAALRRLADRMARGASPKQVAKAARGVLERYDAHRYFDWEIVDGAFRFFERPQLAQELLSEGKYVIRIEKAVALRRGQRDGRGWAPTVVAALALLLERALERKQSARLSVLAVEALRALQETRIVDRWVATVPAARRRPTDHVRRFRAQRATSFGAPS